MEVPAGGLGRCQAAFWLALSFDAAGFAALLAGVFLDAFFADLLIYGGGVGIFFSLMWWVFWYVGNLEVPPAELEDDVGLGGRGKARGDRRLAELFRSLSLGVSFSRASVAVRSRSRWARATTSAPGGGAPVVGSTVSRVLELEPEEPEPT
uniref:Transmembrane protein 238-like n=1 Tax=Pogona vitticeps TaxID=103695 RepID=A0ABM5F0K8_9SAUR